MCAYNLIDLIDMLQSELNGYVLCFSFSSFCICEIILPRFWKPSIRIIRLLSLCLNFGKCRRICSKIKWKRNGQMMKAPFLV